MKEVKEVTEWNGKPRWMWVWDNDKKCKRKEYVVYILTKEQKEESHSTYPVRCGDGTGYCHCAEIEEKRPCTRQEFLEMLKKQGLPMLKLKDENLYFIINSISDNNVYIRSENQSYKGLCEQYTLLDDTELWVVD